MVFIEPSTRNNYPTQWFGGMSMLYVEVHGFLPVDMAVSSVTKPRRSKTTRWKAGYQSPATRNDRERPIMCLVCKRRRRPSNAPIASQP